MSTPARRRSVRFEDPRDVRTILTQLNGHHGPAEGHEGGSFGFAAMLAVVAAVWVVWLARDLGEGMRLDWRLVAALAGCAAAAVFLAFYILKTNTDRYEFGAAGVICRDRKGAERWRMPLTEIDEVILVRVRGGRFFMYLLSHGAERKCAVHSHESISEALRRLELVRTAFEARP